MATKRNTAPPTGPYPVGSWLEVYTTSLRGAGASVFLGELTGYTTIKSSWAHIPNETGVIVQHVGMSVEVPLSYVIRELSRTDLLRIMVNALNATRRDKPFWGSTGTVRTLPDKSDWRCSGGSEKYWLVRFPGAHDTAELRQALRAKNAAAAAAYD